MRGLPIFSELIAEEREVVSSNGRVGTSSPSNSEVIINPAHDDGGEDEMKPSLSNGDDSVGDDGNKESSASGGGGGVMEKDDKEATPTSDVDAPPTSDADVQALNGGNGVASGEPPTIEVEVLVERGADGATPLSPLSATPLSPIPSSSESARHPLCDG